MAPKYPTPHKYDELGPTGKRLARVPRYGRLIAVLPRERFSRLRSEAATFWEVYTYIAENPQHDTGVLDGGLRAYGARHLGGFAGREPPEDPDFRDFQVRRACDILGAVAFEMYLAAEAPQAAAGDTEQLKKRVVNRLKRAEMLDFFEDPVPKPDLLNDLNSVFAMDAADLKYFIFSAFEREVRWTDITTQAFFAAYWACRWAGDDDRRTMWKWLPDPLKDSNEVYLEFWRFATEMPVEAIDASRSELLLSPLYDGTWKDDFGLPIRSTELIYRSWDRMKDTKAGRVFRGEFPQLVAGKGSRERVAVARKLLEVGGESPFLSLCEGERGAEDTGRFLMGTPDGEDPDRDGRGEKQDNPLHPVRLTHYRLHRYCVTNAEYELFDRPHQASREFGDKVRDVGRHPVVNVGWHDAWCFARWLGEIEANGRRYRVVLPSEAQWEYACRAGAETPFTWSGDRDGNRIESDYCNFDGNYPWERPGMRKVNKGSYRQRTVLVDGVDEDGTLLPANCWGVCQMHGNVWEWCQDWYDAGYYRSSGGSEMVDPRGPAMARARGLRGGSWINYGRDCRSGDRSGCAPDFRLRDYGFRLAAVPAESKSAQ